MGSVFAKLPIRPVLPLFDHPVQKVLSAATVDTVDGVVVVNCHAFVERLAAEYGHATLLSVPPTVADAPGKGEGLEEIVDAPAQNDDVIDV